MSFEIISTVNPIVPMKIWGKSFCALYMKETIKKIDNYQPRFIRLIEACLEV